MLKKPKLLQGPKLTKALDQEIRDIFKLLYGDNPKCFVCGHMDHWWKPKVYPHGIQVGHYIARQTTVTRWFLPNLFPQCSGCNIHHNSNPSPFTLAIIRVHGQERIEQLEKMAREAVGKKIPDWERRDYLEELRNYKATLLTNGSSPVSVVV